MYAVLALIVQPTHLVDRCLGYLVYVVVPKVMGKPPTKPEEFHFKTDDRVKTHGMETRQDQSEHKDFNRMLRSHEHSPVCCVFILYIVLLSVSTIKKYERLKFSVCLSHEDSS